MVLGNPAPPDPADHEPKSDLHCPKNRRVENLVKTSHSVLPTSYIAQSQTADTKKKKIPAIPLERRNQCQRRRAGGRRDYRGDTRLSH